MTFCSGRTVAFITTRGRAVAFITTRGRAVAFINARGRMNGWMDGWMDECMYMCACLYVWMDGWVGGWVDGWMEVAGGVRTMSARPVLWPEKSPDSRPPAGHHSCEGWCTSRSAACCFLGAPGGTRKCGHSMVA